MDFEYDIYFIVYVIYDDYVNFYIGIIVVFSFVSFFDFVFVFLDGKVLLRIYLKDDIVKVWNNGWVEELFLVVIINGVDVIEFFV